MNFLSNDKGTGSVKGSRNKKKTRHAAVTHIVASWLHWSFRFSHIPRRREVEGPGTSSSGGGREEAAGVGQPGIFSPSPPNHPFWVSELPSFWHDCASLNSHNVKSCEIQPLHACRKPPSSSVADQPQMTKQGHQWPCLVFCRFFNGQPPKPAVTFGQIPIRAIAFAAPLNTERICGLFCP